MAVHELEEIKQEYYWGNSSRAWMQRKRPGTSVLSVKGSVRKSIPHDVNDHKQKSWPIRLFMYAASAASLATNLMVLWPVLVRSVRFTAMAAVITYRQGRMKLSALHDYMGCLLLSRRLLCFFIVFMLVMQSRSAFFSTRQHRNSNNDNIAQSTNIIMSALSADELDQLVLSTAAVVDLHDIPDHHEDSSESSSSVVSIFTSSSSTTVAGSYNIETPPTAAAAVISLPVETPARPAAVIVLKKQRSCSSLQLQYDADQINNGCSYTSSCSTGHGDRNAALVVPRRPAYQANSKQVPLFRDYSKQVPLFRDYYKSALNRLSSEQFRSRVDTFLLKHRKRMWAEALKDESFQYMVDGNTLAV